MTKRRWLGNIFCSALLLCLAPISIMASGPAPDFHDRFMQDGPVYMATGPNGELWAVWSFDNGLETDIAVSRAVGETWDLPTLVGRHNGADDLDPRIGFMQDGTPLLVWWQQSDDGSASRVVTSYKVESNWTRPNQISPADVDSGQPNLFNTASEPSIGYVVFGNGSIQVVPARRFMPNGGADGPDPMPTVGLTPLPRRQPTRHP